MEEKQNICLEQDYLDFTNLQGNLYINTRKTRNDLRIAGLVSLTLNSVSKAIYSYRPTAGGNRLGLETKRLAAVILFFHNSFNLILNLVQFRNLERTNPCSL